MAGISQAGESLGDGTLLSPPGQGSVPGGGSPTAGATSPQPLSLVPAYGCTPRGCHTSGWPRPRFFTGRTALQVEIQAAVPKMWCFTSEEELQRLSVQGKNCPGPVTHRTAPAQPQLMISDFSQPTLALAGVVPVQVSPGTLSWHRNSIKAQNWHELQRRHLGSFSAMSLCHPHSH